MSRFLRYIALLVTTFCIFFDTSPAGADSPVIWNGSYARNLTSKGFLLSTGSQLNNDGPVNYAPQRAIKWTAASNVTVTDDTTPADLARANTTANGLLFAATGAGNAYFCATLDTADYNKLLSVKWDQNATAGVASTYVAGDFQVDISSATNSTCTTGVTRLPLSTDASSLSPLPALSGTYQTTFTAPGSTAAFIKVQITRVNNSHSIVLSNLYVGPQQVTQGAAVTPWTAYTPTGAMSTNTTYTGQYRRVGDLMEIDTLLTFAGAPTSTSATVSLPTGFTINTAATVSTTQEALGIGAAKIAGAATLVHAIYASSTTLAIVYQSSTAAARSAVTQAAPGTIASGDSIQVRAFVPVNEWVGAATVNIAQNDLSFYYSTGNTWGTTNASATTTQGQAGVLGGTTTPAGTSFTYTFVPSTPVPVGAKPVLEVSVDQLHWEPTGGFTGSQLVENLRYDGTNYIGGSASLNSSGNIAVTFGKYASGTTTAWTGTWYWRVTVGLPGQAIGFASATSTSSGLVDPNSQTLAGAKTWNDVQTWKYSSGATTAGSYDTSGQFTIGPSGATSSTTHTVNGNISLPIAGGNLRLVGSGTTANNGAIGFADESNVFTNGLQMQALGSTSSRRVAFFGGTSLGTEVASVYATGKLKVGPGSANGVISFNDAVGMYLATSSANQTCSTTCTGVLPLSIAATVCISGWNSTDNLALATCGTSPGAGKNTRCLCAGIF